MADVTLRPTGAGSVTGFPDQNPGTGSHWDKVDEAVADGDSTYVYNGGGAECRDLYDVTPTIPDGATIISVQIVARARGSSAPNPGAIKAGFKDGTGEWFQSSWHNLTDGVYSNADTGVLTTNPRTSSAWTLSEINALEIGATGQASGFEVVTQVYAVVSYEEGSAQALFFM